MRLVCFTNAGNEENIYTNEGLGARRVPQLLEWCRANSVEMLAPQLPGRGMRLKEPFLGDAQVWHAHTQTCSGATSTDVTLHPHTSVVGAWLRRR